MIVEETEWLGGMLTSAGVSAVDGNYDLPEGLFGEFRGHLADVSIPPSHSVYSTINVAAPIRAD